MRAWVIEGFGGVEKLSLSDIPEPAAGEGEVVVDVKVAGVNPVDRSTLLGRFDWIRPPFVTGAEFAGVISSVGSGVSGLSVGTRVLVNPKLFCGRCYYCLRGEESACLSNERMNRAPHIIGVSRQGGWRQKAEVPAMNLIPIPEGLPTAEACTLGVDGATAWHLVKRSRPEPGDFALVVGSTGGVGMFAVQIAKMYGCEVAAVVGSSEHAKRMKQLGADHAINRNEQKVVEEVRKLTNNRGADIVLDPLGSATFEMSSSSLAPLGRYATCGTLTGTKAELSLLHLYSMQVEYIGSTTFSRADLNDALNAVARRKLIPQIDSKFRFDELPAAMRRLDEHGRFGKVLVEMA